MAGAGVDGSFEDDATGAGAGFGYEMIRIWMVHIGVQ